MIKICKKCKKGFMIKDSRKFLFKSRKFCSEKCYRKSQRKRIIKICKTCKNKFESLISKNREYCSIKCKLPPNFKSGHINSNGYIKVLDHGHPFSDTKKYVFEHRLIMEKFLGRYLTKNEIVHHRNGIKNDNRIENLLLCVVGKNFHIQNCPKCNFKFAVK